MVVAYGLFHGLLFFPVILSLIGPDPFPIARPAVEVALNAEELEPQLSHHLQKSEIIGDLKEEEAAIKKSIDEECIL